MSNQQDSHEPESRRGSPLLLLIVLAVLVLCFGLMLVLALFVKDYRTIFLVLSCVVSLPMIGLGGFLIYAFAMRPPDVVHEVHEVDRPIPVWDDKAHTADGLLNQLADLFPDLAKLWREDFNGHMAERAGVTHRAEPVEHIEAQKVPLIMQILNWLKDFVSNPSGQAVTIAALDAAGDAAQHDDHDGGGGGGRSRIPMIIGIGCVTIFLCCCLLIGGWWFISRSGPSSTGGEPTLAPVSTPINGLQPVIPPLSNTPIPSSPNNATTVPSGGSKISSSSWEMPCDKDTAWCFGGYTAEGNVHLFAWLPSEISAHCTVPASNFNAWTATQWDDPAGYFNPLREWYHTNYDKSINLSAEAGNICAASGGQPK